MPINWILGNKPQHQLQELYIRTDLLRLCQWRFSLDITSPPYFIIIWTHYNRYRTGHYSPSSSLFIESITMMPHVEDLELVGPWALDLETPWTVVYFVGPTTLAQTGLNACPKPKNHNGTIMVWTAKVRPC